MSPILGIPSGVYRPLRLLFNNGKEKKTCPFPRQEPQDPDFVFFEPYKPFRFGAFSKYPFVVDPVDPQLRFAVLFFLLPWIFWTK